MMPCLSVAMMEKVALERMAVCKALVLTRSSTDDTATAAAPSAPARLPRTSVSLALFSMFRSRPYTSRTLAPHQQSRTVARHVNDLCAVGHLGRGLVGGRLPRH